MCQQSVAKPIPKLFNIIEFVRSSIKDVLTKCGPTESRICETGWLTFARSNIDRSADKYQSTCWQISIPRPSQGHPKAIHPLRKSMQMKSISFATPLCSKIHQTSPISIKAQTKIDQSADGDRSTCWQISITMLTLVDNNAYQYRVSYWRISISVLTNIGQSTCKYRWKESVGQYEQ